MEACKPSEARAYATTRQKDLAEALGTTKTSGSVRGRFTSAEFRAFCDGKGPGGE